MSFTSAELRAGIEEKVGLLFEEVDPEEPNRFMAQIFTRRKQLSHLPGVEAIYQEIPVPNTSGRPSGEYTLTIIDNREIPARVFAFSDGSQLGAVACECLNPEVATNVTARSEQDWHGVGGSIGNQLANYVLFTLDPELHSASTSTAA